MTSCNCRKTFSFPSLIYKWMTYPNACDEWTSAWACELWPTAGIKRYPLSQITFSSPIVLKLGPTAGYTCDFGMGPQVIAPGEYIEIVRSINGGVTGKNVTVTSTLNWPGNAGHPANPDRWFEWRYYWYRWGVDVLRDDNPPFFFGSPAQVVVDSTPFVVPAGEMQELHLLIGARNSVQVVFSIAYTETVI